MSDSETRGIKAAAIQASAALSAIRGDQTIQELATEYGVEPAQIEAWKRHLERFLAAGFSAPPDADPAGGEPKADAAAQPRNASAVLRTEAPAAPAANVASMYRTLPDLPTVRPASERAGSGAMDEAESVAAQQDHHYQMLVLALESELYERSRAQVPGHWLGRWLRRLFVGWIEDRQARRTSQELLRLYAKAKADYPDKSGVPLYRQILFDRLGGSVVAADAVLVRAEESFASWPTQRPLKFRDVAHCLAVMEFLESNRGVRWTRKDFRQRVASYIPENL